jgi:prophage regulatory protein
MTEDRYIRIKELAIMLSIGRSTIYKLMKKNQFPQQIKLSERTVVWRLSVINEWINEREKLSRLIFV